MWTVLKRNSTKRLPGRFTIANGGAVLGELTLDGDRTELRIRSDTPFRIGDAEECCIVGALDDRTRVSLFDCIVTDHRAPAWRDERYTAATLYAHYALLGAEHIRPDEFIIRRVSFVIDDAHVLFHDNHAYGSVLDAGDIIRQVLAADKRDKVETGPHPWVTYYTGKREIACVATCLGELAICHNPSGNFGDATGVRIDNTISIDLDLPSPSNFADVMARTLALLRYVDVVAGRPQNVLEISVTLAKDLDGHPVKLDVYWCAPPRREAAHERREPHAADVLLSPVRNTATFGPILARWLEMDHARLAARQRFSQSFGQQRFYTIDRLVGAANMFDLLPENAVPATTPLTPELEAAKKQARTLFANLPESLEQQSMLNAIGRIGKSNLKQKIRHRVKPIIESIGPTLANLPLVTDQAVVCRNYYVHGGRKSFDYHFETRIFLTDTLEFVFAASDLIDAGSGMKAWVQRHSGLSHPFAGYIREYDRNLQKLLEHSKTSKA